MCALNVIQMSLTNMINKKVILNTNNRIKTKSLGGI